MNVLFNIIVSFIAGAIIGQGIALVIAAVVIWREWDTRGW